MAKIFMVIVGFFYFGIVRGRKIPFEGRLNSWKWMMKKQGAHFCRNGSPFDLKISDFWPVLDPLSLLIGNKLKGRGVGVSRSCNSMTSFILEDFSVFSPPRSLQYRSFCALHR